MKFNKVSQQYKQVNNDIREEMRLQKIKQKDLAYMLNIKQQGLSARLSGKTEWSFWEILNACEILGIQIKFGKEQI